MGEEKLSLPRCRRLQTARASPLSSPLQPPRAEQVVQRQMLPRLGWQLSTLPWKKDFSQASQPFSEKQLKNPLCATERPRRSSREEAAFNLPLH